MKKKRLLSFILATALVLLLGSVFTAIQAYRGTYIGEDTSPDGMFTLRYYKSFNPMRIIWSMPGDTACTPEWVRLYDSNDEKLNELYSTSCQREMDPRWINKKVYLPDGVTVWILPRASVN